MGRLAVLGWWIYRARTLAEIEALPVLGVVFLQRNEEAFFQRGCGFNEWIKVVGTVSRFIRISFAGILAVCAATCVLRIGCFNLSGRRGESARSAEEN